MKKKAKISLFWLFLGLCQLAFAQPIGSWQGHFSYQSPLLIVANETHIMCAAQHGLFLLNLSNRQIRKLDKTNGLSDVNITAIFFHRQSNKWLIGYASGLIDIISEGKISTIRLIGNLNQFSARSIRQFADMGRDVLAATDIGIVRINMERAVISDIYREIGPSGIEIAAQNIVSKDLDIYANTDKGILVGSSNQNLLDFGNWQLIATPDTATYQLLRLWNQHILSVQDKRKIIRLTNEGWQRIATTNNDIVDISEGSSGELFILTLNQIISVKDNLSIEIHVANLFDQGQALALTSGTQWVADLQKGLIEILPNVATTIVPDGPVSDDISSIKWERDRLFAFYQSNSNLHYLLQNSWRNEEINGAITRDATFFKDGWYFATNQGVYHETSNSFVANSEINQQNVTGLSAYDDQLLAIFSDGPLSFASVVPWINYSTRLSGLTNPNAIYTSPGGAHWITFRTPSSGISVIGLEQNLSRRLTQSAGIPSGQINQITFDNEGEAWVAGSSGLVFFMDGTFVFGNERAIVPFFEGRELFDGEIVNAIMFDGGNRAWIGTNRGLWVFEPGFTSISDRFTSSNSPLPSNSVKDIAISANGIIYILTDAGLVSFRSNSSTAGRKHQNVKIFPNPASLKEGVAVGIDGLAGNAKIKITSIDGTLIKNINAYGSTASWDLTDRFGQKVASGVYLFFSTTTDGQETYVGKIAVTP